MKKPEKLKKNLEKEIAVLPPSLRKEFERMIKRLKKYGLKDKEIIQEIKARKREIKKIKYSDKRFDLANKDYLIYRLFSLIGKIIRKNNFKPEEFKKIGRLFFDLNGLKAINDLFSHQTGDKFLKRIALTLKKGETTRWLRQKMKIKTLISSEGGDEFGVLLVDKKPIDRIVKIRKNNKTKKVALIDLILDKYKNEIEKIDFSDIIDFQKKEIKDKIKNFLPPKGFKFKAILSGGRCTLYQAWEEAEKDINFKKDSPLTIVKKIASSFFDLSDNEAKKDKKKLKEKISQSANPELKFLAIIYQRNRENWELEAENQKLKEKISSYQKIVSRIKNHK